MENRRVSILKLMGMWRYPYYRNHRLWSLCSNGTKSRNKYGLCVAMEPNHAISISGHKITIFTELMSANDTYRTLSIKFI